MRSDTSPPGQVDRDEHKDRVGQVGKRKATKKVIKTGQSPIGRGRPKSLVKDAPTLVFACRSDSTYSCTPTSLFVATEGPADVEKTQGEKVNTVVRAGNESVLQNACCGR